MVSQGFNILENGHQKMQEFFSMHPQYIRSFSQNEKLFDSGESTLCFYLLAGEVSIFQSSETGEQKEVGYAKEGELLGEGVFFGKNTKTAVGVCKTSVKAAVLDANEFDSLREAHPFLLDYLLVFALKKTNERLMESGKELAMIYDIISHIGEKERENERGFCEVLTHIKNILGIDFIISVDTHQTLENILFYRFNTRFPSVYPINSRWDGELDILQKQQYFSSSPFMGSIESEQAYSMPLEIQGRVCGYLIFGKKTDFLQRELRIIRHVSKLLASVVYTMQIQAEQKAAQRLRENTFETKRNFV